MAAPMEVLLGLGTWRWDELQLGLGAGCGGLPAYLSFRLLCRVRGATALILYVQFWLKTLHTLHRAVRSLCLPRILRCRVGVKGLARCRVEPCIATFRSLLRLPLSVR